MLPTLSSIDDRPEVQALFNNLKTALPALRALHSECQSHWGYEDPVYRFYHSSFKVFAVQGTTVKIVDALQALAPGRALNRMFLQIVGRGTGKTFSPTMNSRWFATTRPIIDAFFHARYFLDMAIRHGEALKAPPNSLPSGWAAFLYLYNLR